MKTKLTIAAFAGSAALFFAAEGMAQTTPGPQPTICARTCWVARAPSTTPTQMAGLTRMIIHHTAGSSHFNTTGLEDSKANIRGVQNYHMDVNGWSDIGYHFLVDKFGNLFEGRSGSMTTLPRGAHDRVNTDSFSISFLGYFHPTVDNAPPAVMRGAAYDLVAWRMPTGWSPYGSGTYGGATVGFVAGHRNVSATACPGDHVYQYIGTDFNGGEARNEIAARRNAALANDTCAGAIAMTAGSTYSVNTVTATSTGDPTPTCQSEFGKGVWYAFTPSISGMVTVSTCSSDFNTVIQAYTGACGSLTAVSGGCNDDNGTSCTGNRASVSFSGTAGTTYRVLAGGYAGASGNLSIVATVVAQLPDLEVLASVTTPAQATAGSSISVSYTLKNIGGAASGAFGVRVALGTTAYGTQIPLADFSTTSLAPDESRLENRNVTIPANVTPGSYWVTVFADGPAPGVVTESREDNNIGSTTPNQILINPPPTALLITTPPGNQTVTAGNSATFTVAASGNPTPSFQWQRSTDSGGTWNNLSNDGTHSGVTTATLTVNNTTTGMSGYRFRAVASNADGSVTSNAAVLTVNSAPPPQPSGARLINVSTRANAGSGEATLIVGFVIDGTGSKTLLIRGVGPKLTFYGVQNVVTNPALKLYSGQNVIAENDDWASALAPDFATVGAFALDAGSRDAAMKTTLAPGAYTIHLVNPGAVAEALVEVYDFSKDAGTRLINLSCRLHIGSGDTVIVGTVLEGSSMPLILRNIGPGLTPYGVTGILPDPKLRLFSGQTVIAENDDWSSTLASHFAAVGAFPLTTGSKDAAHRLTVTPGAYTVHATGTGPAGVALVELYESK